MKKISVCMATYNGEKYIKEQIDSILLQLSNSDELIISDDNSTDNTINIIKQILDSRIKLFFNSEKGYTSNFENALNKVQGDIIFLSDQDDMWLPNKVEVCLKELESYDFVVSDCAMINTNNEIISDSYFGVRSVKKSQLGNLVKFGFLGCCLAFRADILKKALPFPANRRLCTHDNWLFLVGAFLFKYKVLDDKLIHYRRHSNNFSTLISKSSLWFKIKYRVYLCFFLIKRYNVN